MGCLPPVPLVCTRTSWQITILVRHREKAWAAPPTCRVHGLGGRNRRVWHGFKGPEAKRDETGTPRVSPVHAVTSARPAALAAVRLGPYGMEYPLLTTYTLVWSQSTMVNALSIPARLFPSLLYTWTHRRVTTFI